MNISGTHLNYYFFCHRELWLFAHGLQCEHESDAVRMGKHIHETTYLREEKEIDIDTRIVLDFFDPKRSIVHEVKKSDSMEEAHLWQLRFYLWYLKQKGMTIATDELASGIRGELNYPLQKKKVPIYLSEQDELYLTEVIFPDIQRICSNELPPPAEVKKVCSFCSYNDLCYS